MFYLDANEEAIRHRFNILSLYHLVAFYVLCYYFLDRTYAKIWFGFPIALFSYLIVRCLIHRKRSASAPPFYNNKSKFFKLLAWTLITNGCFFALQYLGHYPVLSQAFTQINTNYVDYVEYSDQEVTGTSDIYWSFRFNMSAQDILPESGDDDDRILLEDGDAVGCGCGNQYGPWGDIIFNPSMPNRYYTDKFGVNGVKIPTWLCLCYSRESCTKKYIGPDRDPTIKLYYRVVGDRQAALNNKVCPPPDMNFIQIYREHLGQPANDSLLLNFTLGFSASMSSLSLLLVFIMIYFTENYGNRITFVVVSSIITVLLEISVVIVERFSRTWDQGLMPFMITFLGSGYIFMIFQKAEAILVLKNVKNKFWDIFRDDEDTRKWPMRVLKRTGKVIWFIVGCFWAVFNLVVVLWGKGRFKIFAMKEFKLSEEKYSIIFKQRELLKKNKLLNTLTLIDAVVFRCGEAAFFLYIIMNHKVRNLLLVDVCLGFVAYEALSCIYPLVRQTYALRSFNSMLESLHPRYFNVTVVRRERVLKREENHKVKKDDLEESIELRRRREPVVTLNEG